MKELNQEYVLSLIQKEAWKPVLDFLYKRKEEIPNDTLLQYSATIFESEFFSKISKENTSITFDNLQELFLLHNGKFFVLNDDNYKTLVRELAAQSEGETAYNYAKLFPEEEVCKEIINKYEKEKPKKELANKIEKMNWIEIYNRLFEVINVQGDASTYFSGPRFINTLKEFNQYHPDYHQYINLRNEQGKSTSRKIYFYDMIMELDENTRIDFINRILEMVEPFEEEKVKPIKALIKGEKPKIEKPKKETANEEVATVFISYSWDSEKHKNWVLELANQLVKEGVNVILDRYELRPGKNLPHFVETSIKKADRIVIIFTPNYKLKAEKRAGGVGYEYSIMNSELYKNQTNNERIIPVLRDGDSTDSIPEFMQQYIHIDMRNDENYENSYTDLLREIYDEPEIIKPEIGTKRNIASS
ncbi:toll/interleukin-1 receptor domain-containing protein [Muricauda sp. SCSIO 64092]|uniref:toll/interleukin-1 receptor domain-containing protein n=1 Tax=Allomuricauda sp. SCSIO 64092 TaxID=2908842 RepID=UPI001FF3EC11|nr:toll/interleukin-1 receptor domain-containing protein [Muricauda sp. SCSIO 64092]UOY04986.1 toll/interleukin-1 receptor domain-containing protein [Muricauda sp. SCSIO 64092]